MSTTEPPRRKAKAESSAGNAGEPRLPTEPLPVIPGMAAAARISISSLAVEITAGRLCAIKMCSRCVPSVDGSWSTLGPGLPLFTCLVLIAAAAGFINFGRGEA